MANRYGRYRFEVPLYHQQQQSQVVVIVQCPNCACRFPLPVATNAGQIPSGTIQPQCIQPIVQQQSMRQFHAFYPLFFPESHPLSGSQLLQQQTHHVELTVNMSDRMYGPEIGNDLIVYRIRDILIDLLDSVHCRYGVTISQMWFLLEQSCAKWNIALLSIIGFSNFKDFLREQMADYIEVQDELYRYRRPKLSIRETNASTSSSFEGVLNSSMTGIMCGNLQKSPSVPIASEDGVAKAESKNQLEVLVPKQEEAAAKNVTFQITGKSSESSDNKSKINDSMELVVDGEVGICNERELEHIGNDSKAENSHIKGLDVILKGWKEMFRGDLKELIGYLRMVDRNFQGSGGEFTFSEFRKLFGDALNKRWESCDIDLVMMGVIDIPDITGMSDEPILTVNPIVKEVEFPEVTALATQIYELLSGMLKTVDSVTIEVIVQTVNFGENSSKTVDEKYVLLWEALSSSEYQDVFVVNVSKKGNQVENDNSVIVWHIIENGFDVMVGLNPNLDLRAAGK